MLVLIDTWWNVNKIFLIIMIVFYIVLIDTWWNVNMYDLSNAYFTDSVLIDTWWNVNYVYTCHISVHMHGFNRYMVECEYFKYMQLVWYSAVLIDTWWNVNSLFKLGAWQQ